jgi:hypothetical protein
MLGGNFSVFQKKKTNCIKLQLFFPVYFLIHPPAGPGEPGLISGVEADAAAGPMGNQPPAAG